MTLFAIVFLGGAAVLAATALIGNIVAWKLEERRENRKRSRGAR